MVSGHSLLAEAAQLHSAFGSALEGTKALWAAKGYLGPFQNYVVYYTNVSNGFDAATLRAIGCRIHPGDSVANQLTGGALERDAQEVARVQAQWTAFRYRYGEVARLYVKDRLRPGDRVMERDDSREVLRRMYPTS
jgi:hypothetical protein